MSKTNSQILKERIAMIAFVIILGTILTTALVWVNQVTSPLIKQNQIKKVQSSILRALNIDFTDKTLNQTFQANITVQTIKGQKIYRTKNGQVAFEIEGPGLWGPISGVLALQPDLKTIKGITIIHQEETPGLGSRIAEPAYLGQFVNKKIAPQLVITKAGEATKNNEVDAISGATLSSKAFEELLNDQSQFYLGLLRGGQ